jgi:hypothetical protein
MRRRADVEQNDTVSAINFAASRMSQVCHLAPTMKNDFFTVLSIPDRIAEAERHLTDDPRLARCFRDSPPASSAKQSGVHQRAKDVPLWMRSIPSFE